jgi:hypothetical protein
MTQKLPSQKDDNQEHPLKFEFKSIKTQKPKKN